MRSHINNIFPILALFAGLHSAHGQSPTITSYSQNGVLVCSGLQPGTGATVAWASSPAGPWLTNWDQLTGVTVGSNGMITVSVPMFYRVVGVAATKSTFTTDGMALIPPGAFTIGNSIGDSDITDANPTNVYVSGFFMDTNLVGFSQWLAVHAYAVTNGYSFDDSGSGSGTNQPVFLITWYDCVKWCNARSQLAGLTPVYYGDAGFTQVYSNSADFVSRASTPVYVNWAANGYRLPTEAEWEKASRGGLSGLRFPWGNSISETQANYDGDTNDYSYDVGPNGLNSIGSAGGNNPPTTPVGSFAANGYGLYDMAGNLFEWCWDLYAGLPYPSGSPYLGGTDPTGPGSNMSGYRVIRGGGWGNRAYQLRCPNRLEGIPIEEYNAIGFRCVRKQ